MQDDRPWLVNGTTETLEVESTHADGHTLKIMLYPGTRVPLGATEDPIRAIAVKRRSEPAVFVPESEIRSCLEDRKRGCQGWNVSASGFEPIEKRGPSAEPPADPADPAATSELLEPTAEAPPPPDDPLDY